jgi:hypothetical protein
MSTSKTETGWLIESTWADCSPHWWTLEPGSMVYWTKDSAKALRFARREDADNFASHFLDGDDFEVRITEHQWSQPHPRRMGYPGNRREG